MNFRNLLHKALATPGRIPMNIIYRIPLLAENISDEVYLKFIYWCCFRKKLNLQNPITFNEKLQWLKLYNRNPLYTQLVDKLEVRKFISEKIGDKYLIPLLGTWDSFEQIEFDKLPNQFVVKCTHDSGGLVICKNKQELNINHAKKKVNKSLKRNFYWMGREWPYKNVKPRIIAEKYMVDESKTELKDYKFMCFNGAPMFMYIGSERGDNTKFDFYDMDFKHIPLKQYHENSAKVIKKPAGFEKMKKLAERLSQDFPHVRVDFYDVNGKIYFGELTFFHMSGFVAFNPKKYDRVFGNLLQLPKEKQSNTNIFY